MPAGSQLPRRRMVVQGDAQILECCLPRQAAAKAEPFAPQIAGGDETDQPVGKVPPLIQQEMPQLALGHRSLVETIGLGFADVALTEIIAGKITFAAATASAALPGNVSR